MRTGVILIGIYVIIDMIQTGMQAKELQNISKTVFGFYIAAMIP